MKKYVLMFTFLILIIPSIVKAEAVDYDWSNETNMNLDEITLNSVVSFTRGENNFPNAYGQGFAVTPTHYVIAQITNDTSNTYIHFINRNTLKIDKTISDYNFGHANDITYNSKTKQLVIMYHSSTDSKNYVAYFDAVKLTYIKSQEIDSLSYALVYDSLEDKYLYCKNSTTYVTDLNFSTSNKMFNFTDYGNKYLTKQGMSMHSNYIYYALYETGQENIYQSQKYSSERKYDNIIAVYNKKGEYQKALYIKKMIEAETFELEGVDFDEYGQMYLFYSGNNVAIYKMNYEKGTISFKLTINKNGSIQDNKYKFKLMDGKNVIEEKSNIGNTVTFSDINDLDVGIKKYKLIDEETQDEYNIVVTVNADSYNKKLIYNISYDGNDKLVIDKNTKVVVNVPNTFANNEIYYVLIGLLLIIPGFIIFYKSIRHSE